jgi:hypothetical protein
VAVPNPRRFEKLGERIQFNIPLEHLAALSYRGDYASLLKRYGRPILEWRKETSRRLLADAEQQLAISVPADELWQRATGAAAVLAPIGWTARAQNAPAGLTIAETSALDVREAAIVMHGGSTYYVNREYDVKSVGPTTMISIAAYAARLELSKPTIQRVTIV